MHLELLVYGTPRTHDNFIRTVQNMEYWIEGERFQGPHRPALSELRYYDIRVLKEVGPLVLRDLKAQMLIEKGSGNSAFHGFNKYAFMVRVARLILGFKTPVKAEGEPDKKYEMPGWCNVFFLGAKDDPEQIDYITKTKREVT